MSHQCDIKNGIHPRPCGMINLSNIISYGRGTLPNLIEENNVCTREINYEEISCAKVNKIVYYFSYHSSNIFTTQNRIVQNKYEY